MSEESDEPTKFVVFIDSLGPDDVAAYTSFIREHCFDGKLHAGNPYVTPRVMGSIYTGKNPGEHGLPSMSRYGQPSRTRPANITLPEIAAESDEVGNVCNFGLPFILPPKIDQDKMDDDEIYWHYSEGMNQTVFAPDEAQPHLQVTGPVGDLSDPEEDGQALMTHRIDQTQSLFNTARSIAAMNNFEVVFLSIRVLDSYCHYRYNEILEGENITTRDIILSEIIDTEVGNLAKSGEVFVFGDHGAREMDQVFKINRWLIDQGYLNLEVQEDKIEWAREEGLMEEQDAPGTIRTVSMPGVEVDEENSVAVSDDPFSTGLTLLDGATDEKVEEMIEGLEDTQFIERVDWTKDMWDGPLLHEAPELFPFRKPGVFVSANFSPEFGGAEITRSGVHHPTGAWGSTKDIDAPMDVTPEELFHIILEDFLEIEPPEDEGRSFGNKVNEEEEESVKQRLRDLGYM